nr:hypothetical protein [Volvox reticuliferus]
MGNNPSLPEKVYSAVLRNDICVFQALIAKLTVSGASNTPAARAAVLEYKDKNGRTPLLVAAAKNHFQILLQLIQLGADVHYINPSHDSAGSALHEAAIRRHEETVKLLLAAGASPFTANAAGRTALDEAVLSGHTGVVRTIEKYAEFSGMVAFKARTIGGLSSKYKARWAVLMPYFPFGRGPEGSSDSRAQGRSSRRCLWLYKDKFSASPRCRLWVDDAAVLTSGLAGTEGTLRLHTSHGRPMGNLVTSFSYGYCVFLRPVDSTSYAASCYHWLVALLNGGSVPGTPSQLQAVATVLSRPPRFVPIATEAETAGSSASALNMTPHSALQVQSTQDSDIPAVCEPLPGDADKFIQSMAALPGEADEAFAVRLASAISVTLGHSRQEFHQQQHFPSDALTSFLLPAPASLGLSNHLQQQPQYSTYIVALHQSLQSETEPECIICLNAPKEVGFLHGDSVHRCVCRHCSERIAVGALCPLCRQPVERVLGVY